MCVCECGARLFWLRAFLLLVRWTRHPVEEKGNGTSGGWCPALVFSSRLRRCAHRQIEPSRVFRRDAPLPSVTATLLEVSIRYLQNDRTNKRPIVAGLVVSDEAI